MLSKSNVFATVTFPSLVMLNSLLVLPAKVEVERMRLRLKWQFLLAIFVLDTTNLYEFSVCVYRDVLMLTFWVERYLERFHFSTMLILVFYSGTKVRYLLLSIDEGS